MKKKFDEFDKFLVGQLKDSELALAYLNEHLSRFPTGTLIPQEDLKNEDSLL